VKGPILNAMQLPRSSDLLVMDLAQVDGNKPDRLIDSQPIQARKTHAGLIERAFGSVNQNTSVSSQLSAVGDQL